MVHVAVVHQHTNNYGDDAAGVALVEGIARVLAADAVDVFYIWHKNGRRLSTSSTAVQHHMIPTLAGLSDRRRKLAGLAALWPLSRWVDRDLANMVRRCRAADVVFVAPAGSNIGIYKDWMYLLTLVVLVRSGIRPRFFQNTIAPSGSRVFDRLASYVLKRSEVSVREAASARWLAQRGVSSYLGVDTALLLEPRPPRAQPAPYIALVPTRLATWHPDFREFDDTTFLEVVLPGALAAVAAARGLDVVIVPHLAGPEAEAAMHESVRDALERSGCRSRIADVAALGDYRDVLAGAAAVVSMRYHGVVLAGLAGVPCVALSYENKMHEAAAYLGLAELELDLHHVSQDAVRRRLECALDEAESVRHRVGGRLGALRSIAEGPLRSAQSALLRP